jgi:hypothetical protein
MHFTNIRHNVLNLDRETRKPPKPLNITRAVSFSTPSSEPDSESTREIADINASDLGQFKLSKAEETRFLFFRGEIQFLMSLTDISESLR